MAHQALLAEYLEMPPVTKAYTTACVLTTLAVQLDLASPFQLYFNPRLIVSRYQIWRLLTTFLFFGPVGFTFLFNLVFTYRYCRDLEDGSFRGRTADFVIMFAFGAVSMVCCALMVNLLFLGQAFTIMLVYVWSRRNPFVRMNFFGLMNFQAPYLPWVLLGFSLLLGNSVAVDMVGIVVGHGYYFLEDVFPRQPGGFHSLRAPRWLRVLLEGEPEQTAHFTAYSAAPEERAMGVPPTGQEAADHPAEPEHAQRAAGTPPTGEVPEPAEPDQQPDQ